jgi:hypothetical protein
MNPEKESFVHILCQNYENYTNCIKKREESFQTIIMEGITEASLIGKRTIMFNVVKLYDYDAHAKWYAENTEKVGLIWKVEVRADNPVISISYPFVL